MIHSHINSQQLFTADQHFPEQMNRDLYQKIDPKMGLYCPRPDKCPGKDKGKKFNTKQDLKRHFIGKDHGFLEIYIREDPDYKGKM